jgi:hypothetical protein
MVYGRRNGAFDVYCKSGQERGGLYFICIFGFAVVLEEGVDRNVQFCLRDFVTLKMLILPGKREYSIVDHLMDCSPNPP